MIMFFFSVLLYFAYVLTRLRSCLNMLMFVSVVFEFV